MTDDKDELIPLGKDEFQMFQEWRAQLHEDYTDGDLIEIDTDNNRSKNIQQNHW